CVNASSLLLIRATSRSDAFALRAALGAARRDIALHVLAESLLFALAGTAIGVALAAVATKLLAAGLLEALPIGAAPSIDASAALFSVALMAALGVLTGLPPALRAASFRFGRGFGAGGRATTGGGRARDVLAVLQIALAMTLLVCAALLAESMSRLWRFDYGFDPSRVLTFRAVVEEARPSRDVNRIHARLLDALEALPGVSAAALTQELPGFDPRWQTDINPESELAANREPGELINVDWAMVSGRYFDALRIPIETGRAITEREAAEGPALLVLDESLARRFWPDGDALGKPIRYDGPEPVRIVGIARNVRAFGREEPGRIKIYTPYGRFPLRDVAVIVRADGPESSALVPAIRAVLSSVDASLAIYDVATLEHKLEQHVMHRSLVTKLVVLFAALASVLAALGIHAVVSYAALQRSRELMIRVALGAHASRIVSLLLGKGLALAVVGVVLGLATA